MLYSENKSAIKEYIHRSQRNKEKQLEKTQGTDLLEECTSIMEMGSPKQPKANVDEKPRIKSSIGAYNETNVSFMSQSVKSKVLSF